MSFLSLQEGQQNYDVWQAFGIEPDDDVSSLMTDQTKSDHAEDAPFLGGWQNETAIDDTSGDHASYPDIPYRHALERRAARPIIDDDLHQRSHPSLLSQRE